jgi:hypothetical protein
VAAPTERRTGETADLRGRPSPADLEALAALDDEQPPRRSPQYGARCGLRVGLQNSVKGVTSGSGRGFVLVDETGPHYGQPPQPQSDQSGATQNGTGVGHCFRHDGVVVDVRSRGCGRASWDISISGRRLESPTPLRDHFRQTMPEIGMVGLLTPLGRGTCGVPEVGSGSLTSGDRRRTSSPRVAAIAVLDLLADARTAPTGGPHVLRQGRRAPRAAP